MIGALEHLVTEGLIRCYGWSTDDPQRASALAEGRHCAVVQHRQNVLADAPEMLAACEIHNLASVNRGPLAMGLLTGKYDAASQLPASDVRTAQPWVEYFLRDGRPSPRWLARLDAMREVLTGNGRTLAQGTLCWLLTRSQRTVPIPGIRTPAQAQEKSAALALGPLADDEMREIARLLRA